MIAAGKGLFAGNSVGELRACSKVTHMLYPRVYQHWRSCLSGRASVYCRFHPGPLGLPKSFANPPYPHSKLHFFALTELREGPEPPLQLCSYLLHLSDEYHWSWQVGVELISERFWATFASLARQPLRLAS